jgi:hypothetical protein
MAFAHRLDFINAIAWYNINCMSNSLSKSNKSHIIITGKSLDVILVYMKQSYMKVNS